MEIEKCKKLNYIVIKHKLFHFLTSLLQIFIVLNGQKSTTRHVNAYVTLGLILGPTLMTYSQIISKLEMYSRISLHPITPRRITLST